MSYVLDTNTLIYFFKGVGQVASHLYSCDPYEVIVPTVVLYELNVGIQKSTHPAKRLAQLSTLLEQVQVLSFGRREAEVSAQIRATLERQGKLIGPYDIQIAGCALANNATLVTHNIKEFERVEGLVVVDWF